MSKICLACKHYEVNELTELGLCKKHNLSMHYAAIQNCFEENKDKNKTFYDQCLTIINNKHHTIYDNFRGEAKSLARLMLGKMDRIEFSDNELEILGCLAYANMTQTVKMVIEDIKQEIKFFDKQQVAEKKSSSVTTAHQYSVSNNGIKTTSHIAINKLK